jgi:hypothetical protein
MLHYLYLEPCAIVEQINTKPKHNYLIVCNADGTLNKVLNQVISKFVVKIIKIALLVQVCISFFFGFGLLGKRG